MKRLFSTSFFAAVILLLPCAAPHGAAEAGKVETFAATVQSVDPGAKTLTALRGDKAITVRWTDSTRIDTRKAVPLKEMPADRSVHVAGTVNGEKTEIEVKSVVAPPERHGNHPENFNKYGATGTIGWDGDTPYVRVKDKKVTMIVPPDMKGELTREIEGADLETPVKASISGRPVEGETGVYEATRIIVQPDAPIQAKGKKKQKAAAPQAEVPFEVKYGSVAKAGPIPSALWMGAGGDQFGVFFEAEDPADKATQGEYYGELSMDDHASGGVYPGRFFRGMWLYRFEIPRPANCAIWLRYATTGGHSRNKGQAPLFWSVDPSKRTMEDANRPNLKDPSRFELTWLPPTGAFMGEGAWKWEKVGDVRLDQGEHVFAMGRPDIGPGGTIHPDCVFITDARMPPNDEIIQSPPAPIDPALRKKLEAPLFPITPDWIAEADEYETPVWYENARVQIHTRLPPAGWMDKGIFYKVAEALAGMNVRAYTRHLHWGEEGAWWPTEVGAMAPEAEGENVAKKIIDNADRHDLRITPYYWDMADKHMEEQHPDWLCRSPTGAPLESGRGHHLCLNSPFRDFIKTRLLELVDLGADGFYFDAAHMPQAGCWCPRCAAIFREKTGMEPPKRIDPTDPVYWKYQEVRDWTIEQAFREWRKACHARNPECVFIVSHPCGNLDWTMMNQRLARISDVVKNEYNFPDRHLQFIEGNPRYRRPDHDAMFALGYAITRDPADGRPPHVWTAYLQNEDSALYATAWMIAHGNVANLDMREHRIPDENFRSAIALGNRVSEHLAFCRPEKWAAFHWAEYAAEKRMPDRAAMWEEVNYPLIGAFTAALRERVPLGVVCDSQLEQGRLDGYDVLFLPAPDDLTEPMERAVAAFEKRGGRVLRQQPGWRWFDAEGGYDDAMAELAPVMAELAKSAPVQTFGGPKTMAAVPFRSKDGDRLVVALAHDATWVWNGRARKGADGKQLPPPKGKSLDKPPLPEAPPVRVVVRDGRKPTRVFDAVSGKDLESKPIKDGFEVAVLPFEPMALVVVEY